ncbi:DnaD domain-containing protein [Enterococcus sp. AZ103]|uniref:DnaD domain-containing protein n=1 Tax=Enterococcus sp. AZ103 TaxID=2774628 RepID=UPI003F23B6A4
MAKGAFQTSREIFENPIWSDVVKFRLFFYIYGNAVFASEGTNVAGIHLKRGQFLRSFRNLQKDLIYQEKRGFKMYSLSTIKTKVEQLVKENRIEIETTEYGTLFTVVNYEEYQGFERYSKSLSERQSNDNRTTTERQPNNNKNDKNDKNEKNIHHDTTGEMKEIFRLYEKLFGSLNSINVQSIQYWCEDLSIELVFEALKRSKGTRSFKYTEGILKKWELKGVKNMDDVKALDDEFEKNKSTPKNKRSVPDNELPETGLDW